MRFGKRISISPLPYKTVVLSVEDGESMDEVNRALSEELKKYISLLSEDEIKTYEVILNCKLR